MSFSGVRGEMGLSNPVLPVEQGPYVSPTTEARSLRSTYSVEQDIADYPPESSATGGSQIPPSSHSGLDPENPGDWVLRHHLHNLVLRLKEPQRSSIASSYNGLTTKIREVWYGRKANPPPSPPPSPSGDAPDVGYGKRFRIDFSELQRMRIRKLQCQLVRHAVKMRVDAKESEGWEQTLEQYIKAIQDYDYVDSRSKSTRNPFIATGEYFLDNYILKCNIDNTLANDIRSSASSLGPWEQEPNASDKPVSIAQTWKDSFQKLFMAAVAGGAFLIGPMWLMVLEGGLYTSLITTSAFVTVFGIWMSHLLPKMDAVLASTAAYAAVLVVFVGTSS